MDPSSPYAMQRLIGLKDRFDVAFACDTDHDRHGIVTRSSGLLVPNHYLSVADRLPVPASPAMGARRRGRQDGGEHRADRSRGQASRSASSTRCRSASSGSSMACSTARSASAAKRAPARRSCAGTARCGPRTRTASRPRCCRRRSPRARGRDPGELYRRPRARTGRARLPIASKRRRRRSRRQQLAKLSPQQVPASSWPARRSSSVLDHAPGNDAAIGGIKVIARERLVRRAPVRHRGHLQDLRGELPRTKPICASSCARRSRSSMPR